MHELPSVFVYLVSFTKVTTGKVSTEVFWNYFSEMLQIALLGGVIVMASN